MAEDPWKTINLESGPFAAPVKDVPRVATARKARAPRKSGKAAPEAAPPPTPEQTQAAKEAQQVALEGAEATCAMVLSMAEEMLLVDPVDNLRDVLHESELAQARDAVRLKDGERMMLVKPGAQVLLKHGGNVSPEWALAFAAFAVYRIKTRAAAPWNELAAKRREVTNRVEGSTTEAASA